MQKKRVRFAEGMNITYEAPEGDGESSGGGYVNITNVDPQGVAGGAQSGASVVFVDVISPGSGSVQTSGSNSGDFSGDVHGEMRVAGGMNTGPRLGGTIGVEIEVENIDAPDGTNDEGRYRTAHRTLDIHASMGAGVEENARQQVGGAQAVPRRRGVRPVGGTSSVREEGGSSSGGVPSVTMTGFAFGVGRQVHVNEELGENYPRTYGLSHEEPLAKTVLNFVGHMMSCSERGLDRKWFKHLCPPRVQLCGWDFKIEFRPGVRITFIGWSAVHRMVKYLEFKIYGYSAARWRHIFDPRFAQHLMNVEARCIDYEYMNTMISAAALGYKLEYVKNSFKPIIFLIEQIKAEARLWLLASMGHFALPGS